MTRPEGVLTRTALILSDSFYIEQTVFCTSSNSTADRTGTADPHMKPQGTRTTQGTERTTITDHQHTTTHHSTRKSHQTPNATTPLQTNTYHDTQHKNHGMDSPK